MADRHEGRKAACPAHDARKVESTTQTSHQFSLLIQISSRILDLANCPLCPSKPSVLTHVHWTAFDTMDGLSWILAMSSICRLVVLYQGKSIRRESTYSPHVISLLKGILELTTHPSRS